MSNQVVDVWKEVSEAPAGRFHYKIMALIMLIVTFDGYNTFIPVYTIHYVVRPWHIVHTNIGLLVSSGLFGFLFGSLSSGFLADRVGRKPMLIAALYVSGVFSLITGLFMNSFWGFIALRFLTGLGLGVLMPLGLAYVNELAPAKTSNLISLAASTGFELGSIFASIAGAFLIPLTGWRGIYYVGSTAILLAVFCHKWLDESPKFILAVKPEKKQYVRHVLSKIRPEKSSLYQTCDFATIAHAKKKSGIAVLFSPRYRRSTIVIWVVAFFSLFQIYGFGAWIPQLMIHRGFGVATSFMFGAIAGGASVIGGYVLALVADFAIGRRMTIMISFILVVVTSLIFISPHSLSISILLDALLGFFIVGGMGILNNYTGQSYDTTVRATGQGMQLGIGRIGAVLGPYIIGLLGPIGTHQAPFFIALAIAAVICSGFILFGGPEVEDSKLSEAPVPGLDGSL